ncbi:hypothetical protein D3C73_1373940 [compost metagenome]
MSSRYKQHNMKYKLIHLPNKSQNIIISYSDHEQEQHRKTDKMHKSFSIRINRLASQRFNTKKYKPASIKSRYWEQIEYP